MFCMNCGKQIPDGQGTMCTDCAAQLVYQAQPVQAPAGTAYMPQQTPADAAYMPEQVSDNGRNTGGKRRKIWIPITAAAIVVVLAIVIVLSALANSAPVKFSKGLKQLLDTGDEYTVLSMIKNLTGETAALFDDGKNDLTLDALIPYTGEINAELSTAKKGEKSRIDLYFDTDAFELENTALYFDKDKAIVTIPDIGSYGVLLSDIGASLEKNDVVEKEEFETLINDVFDILMDLNGTVKEVSEELGKIAYNSIPKGCLSKGSLKLNGEKRSAVILEISDDESSEFMISLLRGIQDSNLLMGYAESYLNAISISDSYYEDIDLDDEFDEAVESLEDEVLWNNLEFIIYFDRKTVVGMTLDIEGIDGSKGEDITAEYLIEKEKGETVREFYFAALYNGDEEASLEIVSTWSGSKNKCTDIWDIAYYDGYDDYTYTLEMDHTVKSGKITDTIEFDMDGVYIDFTHTLSGDINGSFSSSITIAAEESGPYGEDMEIEFGIKHDKSSGSLSSPKYVKLSDGSKKYFDEDALEVFMDDIYDSPLGDILDY